MKRISLLLAGLLLFCGLAGAQNEKISFNETEHDFGVIGEKDGYAIFDFIVTNNSKESILISRVQASCGCTTPSWTKEPIEPGKTGIISVSYNPLGRVAPFAKSITVFFNQLSPAYLKIKGQVVQSDALKKKLSPEEEYPVAIGSYLLKTKELSFGQVNSKGAKNIRLEVFNNSDKPITQKVLKSPKYMTVTFNPAVIPAKTAAIMDVNLNAQDEKLFGNLSGEIALLINETRQSFPYSATVVDDFSQWTATKKASAGKININVSEINFGNLRSGNTRTLKLSNSGKSALTVRAIQSSNPSITVSKTHFAVNPGEIVDVKVNIDKNIQSKLNSTLSIISDDPSAPVLEIAVLADKK